MSFIGWGIIGLGKIAYKFTSDLLLTKTSKLIGVASSNSKRAKSFAEKFNADKYYSSYIDLFKDSEIQIVYIASINSEHYDLSIKAMDYGKSVLCEKPLALDANQVLKMIEVSKKNNVFFMEALWTRFNPTFKKALDVVNKGLIGEIKHINASFSFFGLNYDLDSRLFSLKKGGGSLLDIGLYPVFLSYQILGVPEKIQASANLNKTGVDEQVSILLSYKNAQALLHSSFSHNEDMGAKICGTEGEIYFPSRWHEAKSLTLVKKGIKEEKQFDFKGLGYTYEINECNKCIIDNKTESDLWPHQSSLDLITILDKIRSICNISYS
jgi:predicted dehydrogenase